MFKHILRPRIFFSLLWARISTRFRDFGYGIAFKISSKPNWIARPKFKIRRSKIVPTAKALHRSLYEALAAGNRSALERLGTSKLCDKLTLSIEQRPRNRRVEWQLVRYTKPMRYPRIVDHKIVTMSPTLALRQAVVAISSRQRRVEYDDDNGGAVVLEKEADQVENLVLTSVVRAKNNVYVESPWQISGFAKETTWKEWRRDTTITRSLQRDQTLPAE